MASKTKVLLIHSDIGGYEGDLKVCSGCGWLLTTDWAHVCKHCGATTDFDNPVPLEDAFLHLPNEVAHG